MDEEEFRLESANDVLDLMEEIMEHNEKFEWTITVSKDKYGPQFIVKVSVP